MTKGLSEYLSTDTLKAIAAVLENLDYVDNEITEEATKLINCHINMAVYFGVDYYESVWERKRNWNLKQLQELIGQHVYLGDGTTPKILNVLTYKKEILIQFDNRTELVGYSDKGIPVNTGADISNYIFGIANSVSETETKGLEFKYDFERGSRSNSSLANQIAATESGNIIDR